MTTPAHTGRHGSDAHTSHTAPTLVGTTVIYRRRRYTITEEPELVDNAGFAWVLNSRGHEHVLVISVDDAGRIVRAATRSEPWADVTTEPAPNQSTEPSDVRHCPPPGTRGPQPAPTAANTGQATNDSTDEHSS